MSCFYGSFTTLCAGASTGVPAPGCANYAGADVWFQVTVPASGNIIFDKNIHSGKRVALIVGVVGHINKSERP